MTSLNNQEVSIEEMDLLNIQCASVKGKLNKANYTIAMYKKKICRRYKLYFSNKKRENNNRLLDFYSV